MSALIARCLANTAWTFATMKQPNMKPSKVMATAEDQRVSALWASGNTNTAWAFATRKQLNVELLKALAEAAEQRLSAPMTGVLPTRRRHSQRCSSRM